MCWADTLPSTAPVASGHCACRAWTSRASWPQRLAMRLGVPLEPEVHSIRAWSGSSAAGASGGASRSASRRQQGRIVGGRSVSVSQASTSASSRVQVSGRASPGRTAVTPARQHANRAMARAAASSNQSAARRVARARSALAVARQCALKSACGSAGATATDALLAPSARGSSRCVRSVQATAQAAFAAAGRSSHSPPINRPIST